MKTVLKDGYSYTIAPLITIYADNLGVIRLTKNPEYYKKTKHILIKYHKTRELVVNGIVTFKWIPIAKIVVDGLTKPLEASKFRDFISMLNLIDL